MENHKAVERDKIESIKPVSRGMGFLPKEEKPALVKSSPNKDENKEGWRKKDEREERWRQKDREEKEKRRDVEAIITYIERAHKVLLNCSWQKKKLESKDELPFLCKCVFIRKIKDGSINISPEALAYLLVAKSILFSKTYQTYRTEQAYLLDSVPMRKREDVLLANLGGINQETIGIYSARVEEIKSWCGKTKKPYLEMLYKIKQVFCMEEEAGGDVTKELSENEYQWICDFISKVKQEQKLTRNEVSIFFHDVLPLECNWVLRLKENEQFHERFKKQVDQYQLYEYRQDRDIAKKVKFFCDVFTACIELPKTKNLKEMLEDDRAFGGAGGDSVEVDFNIELDKISDAQFEEILKALEVFNKRMRRSGVRDEGKKGFRSFIADLLNKYECKCNKSYYFPFCFVLICTYFPTCVFNREIDFTPDLIKEKTQKIYFAKPSIRAQRECRADLMEAFLNFADLPLDVCLKNWAALYKLNCSTSGIPEEDANIAAQKEVHKSICRHIFRTKTQEFPDSIGEIIQKAFSSCLPVEEWTLYSYIGQIKFSVEEGYAKFLEKHPEAIRFCIAQVRAEEAIREEYLSCWANIKANPEYIQQLCSKCAESIDWESRENKFALFCMDLFKSSNETTI